MKIYEFLALDDPLQYQAVWDHGKHIDDIIVDKVHYRLFAIGNFHVEYITI